LVVASLLGETNNFATLSFRLGVISRVKEPVSFSKQVLQSVVHCRSQSPTLTSASCLLFPIFLKKDSMQGVVWDLTGENDEAVLVDEDSGASILFNHSDFLNLSEEAGVSPSVSKVRAEFELERVLGA
jgi:hypothetical protein